MVGVYRWVARRVERAVLAVTVDAELCAWDLQHIFAMRQQAERQQRTGVFTDELCRLKLFVGKEPTPTVGSRHEYLSVFEAARLPCARPMLCTEALDLLNRCLNG